MELRQNDIHGGYNTKGYDQFIMKACVNGFSATEVKAVNDWIIGGNQGWNCPLLKDVYFRFNNVDLMDDVQKGTSLKSIEGHLGMDITESTVDFNIDHPWTPEELEQMIYYCKKDVDATEKLWDIREGYLSTKIGIGKRAGLDVPKSLSMTNAKLTAAVLHAQRQEWNDGREYEYPENLDKSVIPQEVLDFFDQIRDMSIPDEELFSRSLEITIGDMPTKYAWGGVHGSQLCYYEEATADRYIFNDDVSSLYPSLIEIYNYLSRNVPSPKIFVDLKHERIEAKHRGDKKTAKELKLPLNTVSGAQENKYNDLYDPKPTRSMRISGQLFLTVYAMRLLKACKTIKMLNFNTDGLMYSIDKSELQTVEEIREEWQSETRFELETDHIQKVWLKDVNNLLMIKTSGEVKTVGGYLNYGISEKGAWAINNTMIIIKKALINYFTKDIPIEQTVREDNDIFDFQIIAKAGHMYDEVYQIIDGEKIPVQRCNRVYATTDKRYGTLYKVKEGSPSLIASLPKHCVVDNSNELSIEDIDKNFYIQVAQSKLNDFFGIKPEKKTRRTKKVATVSKATEKTKNVYERLLDARAMFLESGAKKTGKNMHLQFMYFELDDIVPTATKIFSEVGLIPVVSFTQEIATMTIVNTFNPEEKIDFIAPFNQIQPIISNSGRAATNEMQALGSSITYMRRYLYMLALDICEPDEIDGNLGMESKPVAKPTPVAPTPVAPKPKVPVTNEERKEVKETLTAPTEKASELQIQGLRAVMKKLLKADPTKEPMISQITVQTKSFTEISKVDCEGLIQKINGMLKKVEER